MPPQGKGGQSPQRQGGKAPAKPGPTNPQNQGGQAARQGAGQPNLTPAQIAAQKKQLPQQQQKSNPAQVPAQRPQGQPQLTPAQLAAQQQQQAAQKNAGPQVPNKPAITAPQVPNNLVPKHDQDKIWKPEPQKPFVDPKQVPGKVSPQGKAQGPQKVAPSPLDPAKKPVVQQPANPNKGKAIIPEIKKPEPQIVAPAQPTPVKKEKKKIEVKKPEDSRIDNKKVIEDAREQARIDFMRRNEIQAEAREQARKDYELAHQGGGLSEDLERDLEVYVEDKVGEEVHAEFLEYRLQFLENLKEQRYKNHKSIESQFKRVHKNYPPFYPKYMRDQDEGYPEEDQEDEQALRRPTTAYTRDAYPSYLDEPYVPQQNGKFLDEMPTNVNSKTLDIDAYKAEVKQSKVKYDLSKEKEAPNLANIRRTQKDPRFQKNSLYDLAGKEDWRVGTQGSGFRGPVDHIAKNKSQFTNPEMSLKPAIGANYSTANSSSMKNGTPLNNQDKDGFLYGDQPYNQLAQKQMQRGLSPEHKQKMKLQDLESGWAK